MLHVKGVANFSNAVQKNVVSMGNFDGVHVGHQNIIRLAVKKARERQGHCIAYTFRPHPQSVLRPEVPLHLLTTYEEKLYFLAKWGVDTVIEEPFDIGFSTLEPAHFFKENLLKKIQPEVIVVGYDFTFGKGRLGHLRVLQELCDQFGIELMIVEPQKVEGQLVSSSKIRECLKAGEVERANRLLGRPFAYQGCVVHGERRGRQLGFPTANIEVEPNKLMLPLGVYATWAVVAGKCQKSVTNIGVRPTFQKEKVEPLTLVETHIFDAPDDSLNLYGLNIEIQILHRIRGEIKFSQIEDLKGQIRQDIESARAFLARL